MKKLIISSKNFYNQNRSCSEQTSTAENRERISEALSEKVRLSEQRKYVLCNETIDNATNLIMDYLREKFKFDSDSDIDDEIYTYIHFTIKGIL